MFKVNNRNIRTGCEICSKLTIICSSVSFVNFEQVNTGRESALLNFSKFVDHVFPKLYKNYKKMDFVLREKSYYAENGLNGCSVRATGSFLLGICFLIILIAIRVLYI